MAGIDERQGFIGGMMKQNLQFTEAIKGFEGGKSKVLPASRRVSV